jgi:poly(A) polymerase
MNAIASFGAEPSGLLDLAVAVAREGTLPPPEIAAAARGAAPLLGELPPDRLRAAIEAVIMGRSLDVGLQWMHEAGVLGILLPELEVTVDFSQEAGRRHKDVWEHTKQVVRQTVPHPLVRWAALLHDIGKVKTRVILPDGKVTFHRHAEVGARMWDPIAKRLSFGKPDRDKIRFLILHHLRANAYEPAWTDAAVRRFVRRLADVDRDLLFALRRADNAASGIGPAGEATQAELEARMAEQLAREPALLEGRRLAIDGHDLQAELGLEPGPEIGALLDRLTELVLDDPSLNRREVLLELARSR